MALLHLVLLALWGVLALAGLVVAVWFRHNHELTQRMIGWVMIIGTLTLLLLLPRGYAVAGFGFISFLALKEYFTLIPTRKADRRALFWAYLTIPLHYYWIAIGWYGMFAIFVPVYVFLLLPARMVLAQDTKDFLKSVSIIQWGVMLSVYLIGHLCFFLVLPGEGNQAYHDGAVMLLLVFMLTQANDICQYIWGKTLGNHRIIPKVSPGKTWEGFIGGAISTTLISLAITPFLSPLSLFHAALLGLIIGVTGFLGDITFSAIKRDMGVKDASQLLPGHGGMMDRLDSLTFTAPLALHFIRYLYY